MPLLSSSILSPSILEPSVLRNSIMGTGVSASPSGEATLLADFFNRQYRTGNDASVSSFSDLITHARSGNAVMTDGYGPELIDNGTFSSSDLSGWTAQSATLAVDDNKLLVTNNTTAFGYGSYEFATEVGKTYIFEAYVRVINDDGLVRLGTSLGGSQLFVNGYPSSKNIEVVFTATTTTTYLRLGLNVNSDGAAIHYDNVSVREMPVLKWAPHNLLSYSEEFSQSVWNKANATVSGQEVTVTTASATNVLYQILSTVAGQYRLEAEVKAGTTDALGLKLTDQGTASHTVTVDLTAETISAGTGTTTDRSIEDIGDGWYLIGFNANIPAAGTDTVYFTEGATAFGSGDTFFVRNVRLFRSDLGGMVDNPDQPPSRASYVPTTSSAVYLPRVGHHVYNGSAWVNEGLLAESEARTNLLIPSDFSTSWTTTNATQTNNDAVGPDGLSSAIKLEGDAIIAAHNIKRGAVSISATTTYTFSVFAKAGTHDAIGLRLDGSNSGGKWASFDLTNGLAKTGGGGVASDIATIQDMGNGWFRCSSTSTTDALDTTVNPHVHLVDDYASPASSYDATGDNVYLYGAQLEAGETPSSYIFSSSATTTRAAETFTIPSANLPWPSPQYIGSELVTNGTFDSDISGWTDNSNAGGSIAWNASGYLNLVATTDTSRATQSIAVTTGNVYAVSLEVVSLGGSTLSELYLDGTAQGVFSSIGTYTYYYVAVDSSLDVSVRNFSTGTTVSIDNASVREINPLSVSIAMDGRMTYADTGNANEAELFDWDASASVRIRGVLDTSSTNTGKIQVQSNDGTNNDFSTSSATALAPNIFVPFSVSSRHGSTFLQGALDGVEFTANTTPTSLPDVESSDLDLAETYMGTIGTFRVWDRDIGDAGLVEVTAPSFEPTLSLEFTAEADTSFVVYDWSE